jgi:two-component system, LytTR family, response regulator
MIVDDEPLARRGIRARLEHVADVEIVSECSSGREAVQAIRTLEPDVVFLDVQMPGLDGFGVVRAIGVKEMPVVVFVTAYDQHAVRAFDVHALDYLLKPIDDDRFEQAVARARARLAEARAGLLARKLAALVSEMSDASASTPATPASTESTSTRDGRILVKDRGRVLIVDEQDIDWVEADGDYVRLHVQGRSHLLRETMAAMEARLDPAHFARVHRSAIVNLQRIRELRPLPNREYVLVLRDGARLRASRSYRDRLDVLLGRA